MQLIIILDYVNAFIGTLIAILGIAFIPEIRKPKKRLFFVIGIGVLAFVVGILKINSDSTTEATNKNTIMSLNTNINNLKNRGLILERKLDSNTVFLKRLNEIGIKDSANHPIIYNTKKFNNIIDNVGTLIQQ